MMNPPENDEGQSNEADCIGYQIIKIARIGWRRCKNDTAAVINERQALSRARLEVNV